jgi:hypothetical protein
MRMKPASTTSAGWCASIAAASARRRPRGGEALVVDHVGGDACSRARPAAGVGPVADHGRHLGAEALRQLSRSRLAHNGSHVGAAAGDQDDDVLHGAHDYPCPMNPLTLTEARVLGTLMEKARTVPDSYPMSLNTLVAGCNQRSSREPVTNLTEAEVQEALDGLKRRSLAFTHSGNRVARWEHNFQRAMVVPEQSAVLLGLLMLRGPQTPGELRIHSERWYRFADISSVEGLPRRDAVADRGQGRPAGGAAAARAWRPRVALGAPAVRAGGRKQSDGCAAGRAGIQWRPGRPRRGAGSGGGAVCAPPSRT